MNYHHLSIEERSCIRKYYVDGLSYREIGRLVGRNVSTISREIRRNCTHMYDIPTYYPHTAQKKYLLRRSYCHLAGNREWDGLPMPTRFWAILAVAFGVSLSVIDGAIANVALPTMARMPVSYTHLDVYKRQGFVPASEVYPVGLYAPEPYYGEDEVHQGP